VAYVSISGLPMTVESISPILNPPVQTIKTSSEVILDTVANTFNVAIEDLKGNSRRREISWSRQIAMYLMRQHTDLSLPRIGEEFGGKDHTTVMYSCDKIAQMRETDPALDRKLRQLSDRINLTTKTQNPSHP
jgi:chromosomal replication initiator protein